MAQDVYDNPLVARYASDRMARLWSAQSRVSTWRRLWVALARSEQALGLNISDEQISALSASIDSIDFASAEAYERRFRHDVMAHIHAFGDVAHFLVLPVSSKYQNSPKGPAISGSYT